MSVIVRGGPPGKYIVEAPDLGVDPIEIDESKTLYDGLHSMKEGLSAWLVAAALQAAPVTQDAPQVAVEPTAPKDAA